MVFPRPRLTEAQIAEQLEKRGESDDSDGEGPSQSDDDGLCNISLDDEDLHNDRPEEEDGYDDGPEESQEVFIEPADDQLPALTPPPPTPPLPEDPPVTPPPFSPGSQDMFLPSPQSTITAVTEPPAKRRRLQIRQGWQQPNSGEE
jgi:hypothetical protein